MLLLGCGSISSEVTTMYCPQCKQDKVCDECINLDIQLAVNQDDIPPKRINIASGEDAEWVYHAWQSEERALSAA